MCVTGVLMDIKRMAVHDGPGLRTTLFLKGCPLSCLWCHNPEGQSPQPEIAFFANKCTGCGGCVRICPRYTERRDNCNACGQCAEACPVGARKLYGRTITVEEAVHIALEDRVFFGNTGGVTLSGGEPLMQADFAAALMAKLDADGVHTAIDTCGHAPWKSFEKTLPYCRLYLFDVKHMNSERHKQTTGQGNELILDNLKRLAEMGACIHIRIPLIPDINDDVENLVRTGIFLRDIQPEKVKLLPYYDMARAKYRAIGKTDSLPVRPEDMPQRLKRAMEIMKGMNLPVCCDQ